MSGAWFPKAWMSLEQSDAWCLSCPSRWYVTDCRYIVGTSAQASGQSTAVAHNASAALQVIRNFMCQGGDFTKGEGPRGARLSCIKSPGPRLWAQRCHAG